MVKQTITYTDYFGKTRTEDFYFNLTKMELTEMMVSVEGDMEELINQMINAKNYKEMLLTFKTFVMKAYGERSEDGRLFNKSPEISDKFIHSAAFDKLCDMIFFTEGGEEIAINLMIRSLPAELQKDINQKDIEKNLNDAAQNAKHGLADAISKKSE